MKSSGNFRIRIFPDHPEIFRADPDEMLRNFPDPDEPDIRVPMPGKKYKYWLIFKMGYQNYVLWLKTPETCSINVTFVVRDL